MKLIAVLQSLFLLWLPWGGVQRLQQSHRGQPAPLNVSWEPARLVNGSPCLFRVAPPGPLKSLSGEWQGHKVFFDFDAVSGSWYGFAGVELDTPVGTHQLKLEYISANGAHSSSTHPVSVGRGGYRHVTLRVPGKYTEPDAETLEQIKQEVELKREVFRRAGNARFWGGPFSTPVDDVMTEPFGTQRTFNGKRQSVHQGLDFRAAMGTPVRAMNGGEIVLARNLFFEGGFIVIDHGQGLYTLYMHLSQLTVKEGGRVARGQVVGMSGASGRATGPHLHVGVRWQGTYIDPAVLLSMKLP